MVRNDRILAISVDEETPADFVSVPLDDAQVKQIVFFFASYNKINGKEFKALRAGNAQEAERFVIEATKYLK